MEVTGSKREPAASENADALGIKIPAIFVADVDRIIQFLNVTGLQPETIREPAQSSLFLPGRSTMRQRMMNCRGSSPGAEYRSGSHSDSAWASDTCVRDKTTGQEDRGGPASAATQSVQVTGLIPCKARYPPSPSHTHWLGVHSDF